MDKWSAYFGMPEVELEEKLRSLKPSHKLVFDDDEVREWGVEIEGTLNELIGRLRLSCLRVIRKSGIGWHGIGAEVLVCNTELPAVNFTEPDVESINDQLESLKASHRVGIMIHVFLTDPTKRSDEQYVATILKNLGVHVDDFIVSKLSDGNGGIPASVQYGLHKNLRT